MEIYMRMLVSFPFSFETDLHYDSLTSLQCDISWKKGPIAHKDFTLSTRSNREIV